MNASHLTSSRKNRRQAMALIMVITTVALVSILMVAIFSITQTEYKATQGYVSARSAKQLADAAVAITQAQIQNAQYDSTTSSGRTTHATQPGMVRVYNAAGTFQAAYKLYSSSQMKVTGTAESTLFTTPHLVPSNWNNTSMKARYIDLNEPVVRPSLSGGKPAVYFPVIDPRAFWNDLGSQTTPTSKTDSRIEGFTYSKTSTAGTAQTYTEVVLPTDVNDRDKLRLPMPVEWMYILQDGTTGVLSASNVFQSSDPQKTASADNPIVGRVAFWTDDESCKININTASEPTFMGTPFYYHDRDRRWAHYPGASGEYQRYPGHPATVALSSVLVPNLRLDPYAPSKDGLAVSDVIAFKEAIYDMAPKIPIGGSLAGTLPFVLDDFSASRGEGIVSQAANAANAKAERLFASVDELLFKDSAYDVGTGRQAALYTHASSGRKLFDHDTLERSRFFLTAHSRSPEFSIHSLPRICMWPVADEALGADRRTNFDNIIALCANLNGRTAGSGAGSSYIFRRAQAHHPTYDVTGSASGQPASTTLRRNSILLNYLTAQMTRLSFPKTSALTSSSNANFSEKYGANNINQMAVEIFDYIRSTNLYDGILARSNNGMALNGTGGSKRYEDRDQLRTGSPARTYTDHRISPAATSMTAVNTAVAANAGVVPGHGQVTPAIWEKGGESYRGFGRMFTLSEIGIQVICTADGTNDGTAVNFGGILSGGATAPRTDPTVNAEGTGLTPTSYTNSQAYPGMNLPDSPARWYSNFPPLTKFPDSPTPGPLLYGTKIESTQPELHPSKHPGYQPENWNMTLAADTPLKETEKRVQAIILLEAFCPSLGWTKFYPEYTVVLDGDYIAQIKINDKPLFDTVGAVPVKSDGNIFDDGNAGRASPTGGHASPTMLAGQRGGRPVAGEGQVMISSDRTYVTNVTDKHSALSNYGLTSNCITVDATKPMNITFPTGELKIDIYDTHDWNNAQAIQTIYLKFSDPSAPTTVPSPLLITEQPGSVINDPYFRTRTNSVTGRRAYRRALQGPHYWVYNYEGCVHMMNGKVNEAYGSDPKEKFWTVPPNFTPRIGVPDDRVSQALRGRLDTGAGIVTPPPDASADGIALIPDAFSDVTRTFVPTMGDYRIMAAMKTVPSSFWRPHPSWNGSTQQVRVIHSFTGAYGHVEKGNRLATNPTNTTVPAPVDAALQVVAGAPYNVTAANVTMLPDNGSYNSRQPDMPGETTWAAAANSFGDFDTGISSAREGPYINRPDEGNYFAQSQERYSRTKFYRSSYFFEDHEQNDDWRSGIFMTPNRLVSSPVMFGSLPTQIRPGGANFPSSATSAPSSVGYKPWQTLLFRPHTVNAVSKTNHPGEFNPRDHYLLDMFFMPVVEPYAISEPLSVAGRVNLNYQIMPFTYITRATGMHAVLKGEFMTAIPNGDVTKSKTFRAQNSTNWDEFFDEATDGKYWHRPIDVKETLRQFDEKFTNNGNLNAALRGLFRSASQICELYLIPEDVPSNAVAIPNVGGKPLNPAASSRKSRMDTFWRDCSVTGDNVRERPYANIYSRVTTRSNTFRVHMRAQVIRKARSVAVDTFDPLKDAILSEYRGSTLIERYIDPTDTANPIPDYAASGDPLTEKPLDSFYKFRTLETKRFSP